MIERGAQKETDRERMIEGERGNIEKGEEMQTKKGREIGKYRES